MLSGRMQWFSRTVKLGLLAGALAASIAIVTPVTGTEAPGENRAVEAGPVCTPFGKDQLRCRISKASDCSLVADLPYARNLFCPAAFAAARTMVALLEETVGAQAPVRGFFYYYQTLPDPLAPLDDQAQTTIACLDTPAPYAGPVSVVMGAGTPLCHLVAYVTSAGPVDSDAARRPRNPVPHTLRTYPDYFSKLYAPQASFPLAKFRAGSVFDPIVGGLGEAGRDEFVDDYPSFSPGRVYDPANWRSDSRYRGISGGGGSGWGAEISVLTSDSRALTQLAFGGGGGGGMMSTRSPAATRLGAGGGGGMQFANGYRHRGQQYNGRGLGAGVGSHEDKVQYSYNDYPGSGFPPLPVDRYNPPVIAEYQAQLENLARDLRAKFKAGRTIVLMGGGGMGAGIEYLMPNGQEFVPHALSTQAGFHFSYEFEASSNPRAVSPPAYANLYATQQDLYALLGDDYRIANKQAFKACGSDYANFSCMCPKAHAKVLCLVSQQLGDPKKIPNWLRQQHCSHDSVQAGPAANGLSSYQQRLVDAMDDEDVTTCSGVLADYFSGVNAPAPGDPADVLAPAVRTLTGRAEKVGSASANGKVTLNGTAVDVGPVDLRQVTLTLGELLDEALGSGELAGRANAGSLVPLTLAAGRGNKAGAAIFETASGVQPKVRVELKQKDPAKGELEFSITSERLVIVPPSLCRGASVPRTFLTTAFTLRPAVGPPVTISADLPWECGEGALERS